MLINYKDQLDIIRNIRSGKLKEGLKLDIPELDEYIRFKTSNFNIVLGHANVGKTTSIIYLMLCYSLKHSLKWLVCSTENDSYSLIRKLVEFLDETPINLVSESNIGIAIGKVPLLSKTPHPIAGFLKFLPYSIA